MNRAAIAQLIPHGDSMCMLDQLDSWDRDRVSCTSRSHRRSDNPLVEDGRLHCACLVEFCAQAAALHGALSTPGEPQHGESSARLAYVGAVKNLELLCDYVDLSAPTLTIEARCVVSNSSGSIYLIGASMQQQVLLRGRLVLVFTE